MEFIDTPRQNIGGIVNPETALVTGKIKVTDIRELTRFQYAFPFRPQNVVEYARKMKDAAAGKMSSKEKADLIFNYFLPAFYTPSRVPDWNAELMFSLPGVGDYTLRVDGRTGAVEIDGVPISEGSRHALAEACAELHHKGSK